MFSGKHSNQQYVVAWSYFGSGPCVSAPPSTQGEEYVNSKTLADICFLVEGRPFYAHRIALLASSEAFRAMFNQVRCTLLRCCLAMVC